MRCYLLPAKNSVSSRCPPPSLACGSQRITAWLFVASIWRQRAVFLLQISAAPYWCWMTGALRTKRHRKCMLDDGVSPSRCALSSSLVCSRCVCLRPPRLAARFLGLVGGQIGIVLTSCTRNRGVSILQLPRPASVCAFDQRPPRPSHKERSAEACGGRAWWGALSHKSSKREKKPE